MSTLTAEFTKLIYSTGDVPELVEALRAVQRHADECEDDVLCARRICGSLKTALQGKEISAHKRRTVNDVLVYNDGDSPQHWVDDLRHNIVPYS